MDDRELDRELEEVLQRGEKNLEVIRLAKNWCQHLEVERARFSGVGIPEQMTGLPISAREFKCQYASPSPTVRMDAEAAALAFYDQNCVGCEYREPVGVPNLLKLVQARDREAKEQEEARAARAEAQRAAFEARDARRRVVSEKSDDAQKGLVDLIRELDHDPDADRAHRLTEAAKAAPHRFSDELRDLLYDLVSAGGPARTEGALGALEVIEPDANVLAATVCSCLARGESTRRTVQLLGRVVSHAKGEDLEDSLWAIARLAAPSAHPFPGPLGTSRPDPGPLLEAFRHHKEVVSDFLRRTLRGGSPWGRRYAAHAAAVLLRVDPTAAVDLVPDLVRSVLLIDDRNANPRAAAETALATALEGSPTVVDEHLRRALETSTVRDRELLFSVVARFLRSADEDSNRDAVVIALQHLIEGLSTPDETERLGSATRVLDRATGSHPELVAERAERLLGAAAILADQIDSESEEQVLKSGVPPELLALEAQNRRQAQHSAVQAIVKAASQLAPRFPHRVGRVILDLLESLGDDHDRFRAALIRGMGTMGAQPGGLRMALPALYVGIMDHSTLVRAAAAEAYGVVSRRHAEDLPDLLHEAYLLLLHDPYVIVHKAAVRALDRGRLPERFRGRVIAYVLNLIAVYQRSHDDDAFLATAIDVLFGLHRPEELTEALNRLAVGTFGQMDPNEAWDKYRWLRRRLQEAPGQVDLVLKLLANPETYHFYLDDIAEVLEDLSEEEISEHATRITEIASLVRTRTHEGNPSISFVGALGKAGEWEAAREVVTDWMDDEQVKEWPGLQQWAARIASAIEVERAVYSGDSTARSTALRRWVELAGRPT